MHNKLILLAIFSYQLTSCLSQSETVRVEYVEDINFESDDSRNQYREYLINENKVLLFLEGDFENDTVTLVSENQNSIIVSSNDSNHYTDVNYELSEKDVVIKVNRKTFRFTVDNCFHIVHVTKTSEGLQVRISNNPKVYE